MSRLQPFLNIRTEGALLPSDLLSRLVEGTNLPGLKPEDYHLGAGEKLNEAISRSWTHLLSLWAGFRKAQSALPPTDLGTTLTRERWLLQIFQELGYGRLIAASPVEIDGKTYPISHIWQGQYYQVPIHLVSFRADLDKRSEQRIQGASKASPHGMVQEYLNRSEDHLWAIASNGLMLLILRDNASLTRQAYVEFDLEGIFEGEAYADFRLLWMLCHQSRLEGTTQDRPETCWLEVWSKQAETEGRRALDQLRVGVQKALENLGTGFIAHKANQNLRVRLQAGELQKQDFYRQLLRLVYRMIFLFVAEDRDLLHFPGASDQARSRYAKFYSGQRLRRMAERTRGSLHADLWVGLRLIFGRLGDDRGCPELGLPALGGFLFGPEAMPDLESADLSNEHLLQAVRNLGLVKDRSGWRLVDYRNLGSEELGSVYESLLELNPTMELDAGIFSLGTVAGNQRKTSGSYYTPDSLVQCLLDSALDPVVEEAIRGKSPAEAERAILALKVCDPAVGSGHFLVGAAHRLGGHLARVRALAQGESEPSPLFYQHAVRDIIGHCLYGVDANPMAAELCRVSLWLEAIEPGKPLSFLDHHIRVGNSLFGTTPALLAKGIPDEAFTPIEGDDKEICSKFKRVNRDERNQQTRLFAATTEPWEQLGNLAASMMHLDAAPDDSIEAIRNKERMYEAMVRSGNYLDGQFWADAWCASFVWKKTREFNYPITEEVFRRIEHNPHACDEWMRNEITRLSQQYQFFHWHLAFPDVFHVPTTGQAAENEQMGWNGGFDLVLGNPPWERIKLQEKEWFSTKSEEVMNAPNAAARKRAIARIKTEDPVLYGEFRAAAREAEAESHLVRDGGQFKLCAHGDLNTYSLFAELFTQVLGTTGFGGIIVPTGIATDDSNSDFFGHLIQEKQIVSLFDFENRERILFPEVYYRMRFCLLTVCGVARSCQKPKFTFFALKVEDLSTQGQIFSLSKDDINLINPNSKTSPIFHSNRDAEIVKEIYQKVPILIRDAPGVDGNPWGISFGHSFHMTNEAELFVSEELFDSTWKQDGNEYTRTNEHYLPLYEGRMIDNYDHRLASSARKEIKLQRSAESVLLTSAEKRDPAKRARPRYWIRSQDVRESSGLFFEQEWAIAFMDITSATNARTMVASIVPKSGLGNTTIGVLSTAAPRHQLCLLANICSIVFDYICKQKVSGNHLNMFIVKQLPVLRPTTFDAMTPWNSQVTLLNWIVPRTLELTYTANDLRKFARDVGCESEPFHWDDDRRFLIRSELDAAFFHLFGIDRIAADHVLDAFTIVQRREEEALDEYRTKRVILEIYDAMAEAMRTGIPYRTRLDPPPADPSCRHPKKNVGILAFGSLITDPGPELQPSIAMRIKAKTPFPVEYARISRTRGGAPTLVPHESGAPVLAEILVLDDNISVAEATNMLWRRERRREGTGEIYSSGTGENCVLVEEFHDDPCVSTVLYTDFNASGKIPHPAAEDLTKQAIKSVAAAPEGRDGITYLMDAIRSGIETPLTANYKAEILKQTVTLTLEEALKAAKDGR